MVTKPLTTTSLELPNTQVPYLSYYTKHKISPVSLDITDLQRHYHQRQSLYRLLGITPQLIAGRDVIEFCSGSGYHALYTCSLSPRTYTLVDANETGMQCAKKLFSQYFPQASNVSFVDSLVQDFSTDRKYDVVICEGAIPFQLNPKGFARKLSSHVNPGGLLLLSCVDAVSFLPETLRRLLARKYCSPTDEVLTQLIKLREVFQSHRLTGAGRPLDDWILDNMIQPLCGQFFSVSDAIDTMEEECFEFYASSPHFVTDWRWYKDITPGSQTWNSKAKESFLKNRLNLIDFRYVRDAHSIEFGQEINAVCQQIWDQLITLEDGYVGAEEEIIASVHDLSEKIRTRAPETADSLDGFVHFMNNFEHKDSSSDDLDSFATLFGRGTQFLSFTSI